MRIRSMMAFGPLTLGVALALTVGALATGVAGVATADASDRAQAQAEQSARAEAALARAEFARGHFDPAVRHAEAAVAAQPREESYRVLLGQTYLKSGRFASARDTLADALSLDPNDGRAALQYALAQIATGDWAGARRTVDAHADGIGIADRGLAMALAGDPVAAVALLAPAARAADSDAKLRQNYALSLALAGRWSDARTVVAIDVAPDQVDKRILEWAAFAQPKTATDQVSALLSVTPAVDPGVPGALALNRSARPAVAAAPSGAEPVEAFLPGKPSAAAIANAAPASVAPPPATTTVAAPVAVAVAVTSPDANGIVFGARREIVQPLPGPTTTAAPVVAEPARKVATVAAPRLTSPAVRPTTKGGFYVQLGAYQNAAVAHDAWKRVAARFAGQTPQGMAVTANGASFYRLSVGGFARGDAVALCRTYRASGGRCFVRGGAGDQVAMWAKGRELASR